jgi:hypothetical protein
MSGAAGAFVEKSITADNQFTDPIRMRGNFVLETGGTFVANVVLQRRNSADDSWKDITSDDAGTVRTITGVGVWPCYEPTKDGAEYRAGVKTGGYTSGPVIVRLTQ